jgi:endonuclease/exonuclease/phosphatase family metal-dependent hydrolase
MAMVNGCIGGMSTGGGSPVLANPPAPAPAPAPLPPAPADAPVGPTSDVASQQLAARVQQIVDAAAQVVLQVRQLATAAPAVAVAAPAPAAPAVAAPATATPPPTAPAQAQAGATELRIATFNVLGASHTAADGKLPAWRSGAARTTDAIEYLDRWQVDVAGLQEFQTPQREAFRAAKTGYDMFGTGHNTIVWRTDRFRLVSSDTLKVPYFEGRETEMPVVQLEDRLTGKRAWVVNIHNPADTKDHPDQERHRDEATRRERRLVEQLRTTGMPVFLVGDFNEREEAREQLSAGGLATASDPVGGRANIDWVFGSGPVRFTEHHVDDSTRERQVSDHPIVVATAQI